MATLSEVVKYRQLMKKWVTVAWLAYFVHITLIIFYKADYIFTWRLGCNSLSLVPLAKKVSNRTLLFKSWVRKRRGLTFEGPPDVSITGIKNTAVGRCKTVSHCVIACVLVMSLQLILSCALYVSSIRRNADVEKLQQQVADLRQTVAILQQQQGSRLSSSTQLLKNRKRHFHQQYELQTKQIDEVSADQMLLVIEYHRSNFN